MYKVWFKTRSAKEEDWTVCDGNICGTAEFKIITVEDNACIVLDMVLNEYWLIYLWFYVWFWNKDLKKG